MWERLATRTSEEQLSCSGSYAMRHMRRTSYGRRPVGRAAKSEKEWVCLGQTLVGNAAGINTTVTSLISFEAPTLVAGTPLTADPPQDRTILRIVGQLQVAGAAATGSLGMGLMVCDRVFAPTSGTGRMTPDLDKRWLWWRETLLRSGESWDAQHYLSTGGVLSPNNVPPERDFTMFDISPKVRLEDGKQLAFITFQDTALMAPVITLMEVRVLFGARRR